MRVPGVRSCLIRRLCKLSSIGSRASSKAVCMSGMETTVSYVSLSKRWSKQRVLYLAVVMTTVVEPLSALHTIRSELRRVSKASSSTGVRFLLVGLGLNFCIVEPMSMLNSISSIGIALSGGVQLDWEKILEY